MTRQNAPEIRRCADGTIDFAFYESRARRLRGEAILRSQSRMLAPRAQGRSGAADQLVAAIRSVMSTLATVRHTTADEVFREAGAPAEERRAKIEGALAEAIDLQSVSAKEFLMPSSS